MFQNVSVLPLALTKPRVRRHSARVTKHLLLAAALIVVLAGPRPAAQTGAFVPVTQQMLLNPGPDDWLMVSRTYDQQRFSPLRQITRENVGRLRVEWVRGMAAGAQESVPLVYRGVMYLVNPGAGVLALDATNGDIKWEYRRKLPADVVPAASRSKTLAIFEDLIYFTAPDGYLVALDARTGDVRWETFVIDPKTRGVHSSGPMVVDGKVLSGRTCNETRAGCFVSAHDANTGEELWKFYTSAAPGDPGGDSWGDTPVNQRVASTWGLPGSYDPARNLTFWGVANPIPFTRAERHGGNPDGTSRSAPSDLYSNSTVAIDVATGKLAWYYQHLPGDDWDLDSAHERMLLRFPINPDPKAVKWINPAIPRGQERDVVVTVAEGGGIWVLDRADGKFLWATPFPYDVPDFNLSGIDVDTGRTHINWDKVLKKAGDRAVTCFYNIRSYWPLAYHPGKTSLYIPYADSCLDMTAGGPRFGIPRPGTDPAKFAGMAKVNLSTGRVDWRHEQWAPGNGAVVATAGDVVFWGDLNRRFKAFDADTGKVLWETVVGGIVSVSTITYAVNGKQYVAVMTGEGQTGTTRLLDQLPGFKPVRGHNAVYVFALP